MRVVRDNLDLAQLQATGEGFILNARTERKMHRSRCEAVGAMVSTAYPKYSSRMLTKRRLGSTLPLANKDGGIGEVWRTQAQTFV